jgi:hypothetical protein
MFKRHRESFRPGGVGGARSDLQFREHTDRQIHCMRVEALANHAFQGRIHGRADHRGRGHEQNQGQHHFQQDHARLNFAAMRGRAGRIARFALRSNW